MSRWAYKPNPLTFDAVFAEIEQVGEIFDVQDAAAALVAEQRAELAAVKPAGDDRTALWYSSGSDTPYVGAGIGAPQMILDELGLVNVAADVKDTWSPLGWEAIVAADPDVIVLVIAGAAIWFMYAIVPNVPAHRPCPGQSARQSRRQWRPAGQSRGHRRGRLHGPAPASCFLPASC